MSGAFPIEAIAIGASAGAIEALSQILPGLPADYPWPIFIVVHVPPAAKCILAEIFSAKCKMKVKEAEDKELIRPGVVFFAPANYHLLVEQDGCLSLSSDEPELFSRPSINVLFESAADAYGHALVGIVLTGASSDGAQGLQAICEAGGQAVVQNPATAEIATMPEAALHACPSARVMTLPAMAELLRKLPKGGPLPC